MPIVMYSDLNKSTFAGESKNEAAEFPQNYARAKQVLKYSIITACTVYCFCLLVTRTMEFLQFKTRVAVNVNFMKELYDILPGITLCTQSK